MFGPYNYDFILYEYQQLFQLEIYFSFYMAMHTKGLMAFPKQKTRWQMISPGLNAFDDPQK